MEEQIIQLSAESIREIARRVAHQVQQDGLANLADAEERLAATEDSMKSDRSSADIARAKSPSLSRSAGARTSRSTTCGPPKLAKTLGTAPETASSIS